MESDNPTELTEYHCRSCERTFYVYGKGQTEYCGVLCREIGPKEVYMAKAETYRRCEERRREMGEAEKKRGKKSRRVRCVNTGEVFPSVLAASLAKGVRANGISRVINGHMKSTGGYYWEALD